MSTNFTFCSHCMEHIEYDNEDVHKHHERHGDGTYTTIKFFYCPECNEEIYVR
jgi:hypothetical protein